jgi:hypothetical protein
MDLMIFDFQGFIRTKKIVVLDIARWNVPGKEEQQGMGD